MIDLFRPRMSPDAKHHVAQLLTYDLSGRMFIGEGPKVREFEQAFARTMGVDDVVATNSGTSAIDLALHLCGVVPGSEVITTPMTCTATNGQVITRGATAIWADVDPETGLIDPADVAGKVTAKTKAIIGVDWGGRLCDYDALKRFGVPVIQDAAHSYGTGGDYVCWSFQAVKFLTTGDGGALYAPDIDRARLLRWYGLDRTQGDSFRCSQDIKEVGYKYHMNDIAATIGLANLAGTKCAIEKQQRHALEYCERTWGPKYQPDCAYWLYTMLVDDRDGFIEHMKERGIAASPVHARNDKHTGFKAPKQHLPGVDSFSAREVAIPVGWWLTEKDRGQIIEAVNDGPR